MMLRLIQNGREALGSQIQDLVLQLLFSLICFSIVLYIITYFLSIKSCIYHTSRSDLATLDNERRRPAGFDPLYHYIKQ